jgi:NDP-sugar pyrophosphorylase family protein
MAQIGQHAILWHISQFYASYGFEEFVLVQLAGYRHQGFWQNMDNAAR